jgi:peptidoglycan glycosyltransferase
LGVRRRSELEDDVIWVHRRGRPARRRMTRRGKLTVALPLVLLPLAALALRPQLPELGALGRLLEVPEAFRLAAVDARPPEPALPADLLGRLPVSREAFETALASADWVSQDPLPGARLWETVPVASLGPSPPRTPVRVEYTLDPALERATFRVLERARVDLGHVVILDPERFELLAYASTDPERFPPDRHYPAASLIKVLTAAAALDARPQPDAHRCRFSGNPWRLRPSHLDPPRGGTEVSLRKALATSNNQCFAQMAVHKIGTAGMLDVIRRFGFLEPAGPAHPAGLAAHPGEDRFALGRLGCGLDGCRITPLHAARLAGILADGVLSEPRWITRVVDGTGRELPIPPVAPPRRVLTVELADQLRDMLVDTTTRGTARRAFRDTRGRPLLGPVRVAGTTGSLSGKNPDGRYEWFIGVAPAEEPRIAVAVVVVQSALWWRNSSQVAAEIFKVLACERGACSAAAIDRWLPKPPILEEASQAAGGEPGPSPVGS